MFNITGGMSVLNGYFLTALPQAVFRTQHNWGHVSFNWLFFWQYCHELYLEPNITGKMSVLNGYFLTVLPQAVFRTQPKVYSEAFLQKQLTTLAVNFFC